MERLLLNTNLRNELDRMWTVLVVHLPTHAQTHIHAHTPSDSNMPMHTFAKQANTFTFGAKRVTLTSTQAHLDWLRVVHLEWLLWLNLSFWVLGTARTHCCKHTALCV